MSLATLIDQHPANALALIEGDETTTYGELRDLVAATRNGLMAAGIHEGDRVAVVAGNTRATVVSILGITSAGMVAVMLEPSSPMAELERQLGAVGAAMVLTGTPLPGALHERTATPSGARVDGVAPLPDGPPAAVVEVDDDRLAVMMFTSGTAGSPKAAMISHGNLRSNQQAVIDTPGSGLGPDSVVLAVLPVAHMYGLNVSLLTTLRVGGTVVLQHGFDPTASAELIARHGVNIVAGVPPMWRAFLDTPGLGDDTFAGVHRIASGASALHPVLWREFKDRFGVELLEGYGLTETSPVVSTHIGIPVRTGTVGRPAPGVEVKVVDDLGDPVPADDTGEIKVRSAGVFLGYWEDEEATKAVLDDEGWLSTRDIGVLSGDGYLALVDRVKDLIIVSGFNVYPFEVETVIVQHPKVDQTVVVGRDDEQRGERIVAFVTVAEGQSPPELDEIVAFCRERLARYKCPTELHVVDELPIAASGKTLRRELG